MRGIRSWVVAAMVCMPYWAAAQEMTPKRCDADVDTCRDGCSVELGTRFEDRDKLATCLSRCDERHELCLLRIVAKRQISERPQTAETASDGGVPAGPTAPYMLPPTRYSRAPEHPEQQEAAPVERSGVTRASDIPDEDAKPAVAPAPPPPPPPEPPPAPKSAKHKKKRSKRKPAADDAQ